MDIQVILSALGGAVVAGLVAIFLSFLQGRREHARWLKEQRMAYYLPIADMCAELVKMVGIEDKTKPVSAQMQAHGDRISEYQSALEILGPPGVVGAFGDFVSAIQEDDSKKHHSSLREMRSAMSKAIGVPPGERGTRKKD